MNRRRTHDYVSAWERVFDTRLRQLPRPLRARVAVGAGPGRELELLPAIAAGIVTRQAQQRADQRRLRAPTRAWRRSPQLRRARSA